MNDKHIQFSFYLDVNYDGEDYREYVVKKLIEASEEVKAFGTPVECGASHIHEVSKNFCDSDHSSEWKLQVD